jgi:hypothetical protein
MEDGEQAIVGTQNLLKMNGDRFCPWPVTRGAHPGGRTDYY